ncbi:MAG: TetR family transcriptional regulator C-terminal domain-containing protein [Aestuariivita sp.]|uniref:TetR family transcriptional regulator C-terminal domain-containing protein n=1 Tax=Aestuariivita sp. TaxID=1872407 RepID=UPI003BAEDB6E
MTRNDTAAPRTSRATAKAERRQSLIDATISSIALYGLSGTTLGRVTEIAGTSVGLANFYFDSKEALFEAVLQQLADAERALWQQQNSNTALTPTERLVALADARFDARCCDRRSLAVWFAFWGDAGAREIYRRVVEDRDEERLQATVAIIEALNAQGASAGAGRTGRDPRQIALGLEALYDGLWLNHLLYPSDFRRLQCRATARDHLAALFFDPDAGDRPNDRTTPQDTPQKGT